MGNAVISSGTFRGDQKARAKLEGKGKPVNFNELLRMEPDSGVTNIRKTYLNHWTRWLGVENRCVVPFTSFSWTNGLHPVPKTPRQVFGEPSVD